MRRHWAYLKYVLRHKWFVFLECLKLGVPLWIAILHDWDKFLPDEWFPYARTFYKPDGSKQYAESIDFALAWKQHQHRNKHHWQYWCNVDGIPLYLTMVMIWDRGQAQGFVGSSWGDDRNKGIVRLELHDVPDERITVDPMPDVYRREMLADWRGAGRAITGQDNTLSWYIKNYYNIKLHDETRVWIDKELTGFGLTLQEIAINDCGGDVRLLNADALLALPKDTYNGRWHKSLLIEKAPD